MDDFVDNLSNFDAEGAERRHALLLPGGFLDLCAEEVERAQRYDRPLSVALISIDGLAALRNLGGSGMAGPAFQSVSDLLLEQLRRPDRAGRLGFAEIGVLMPETSLNNAAKACERLARGVRGATAPNGGLVTVSIGVAAHSPRLRDAKVLLMNGYFELRRARNRGGDCVSVASGDRVMVSVPRSGRIH